MVMSWIFTAIVAISLIGAFLSGNADRLAAAIPEGAQAGVTLAISMAGSLCLWSGVGKVMEKAGFTSFLTKFFRPLLVRIFPSASKDLTLAGSLSANICANLLGLGNAATPMGIQAAQRLATQRNDGIATSELCRLVVLNTASIQLIPTNVAAIRTALGCSSPFDILPAVWLTSCCAAAMGLGAAWFFGKLWRK